MKYSELLDLSLEEVKERLTIEREDYFKLKLNHVISPIENPRLLGDKKRNIARILTELRSRENTKA
ncbi:MAG: large subunit ribosomal protein L29 [Flavobacteriales bacterium]|jgi:large subunit ribosomal protein L29